MSEDSYHPEEEAESARVDFVPIISGSGNSMDFPLPEMNFNTEYSQIIFFSLASQHHLRVSL